MYYCRYDVEKKYDSEHRLTAAVKLGCHRCSRLWCKGMVSSPKDVRKKEGRGCIESEGD